MLENEFNVLKEALGRTGWLLHHAEAYERIKKYVKESSKTLTNNASTKLICECCSINDVCDRLDAVKRMLNDCSQVVPHKVDGKLTSYIA